MSNLKFNGWQRLWIVLACIWAIFLLVILGSDLRSAINFDFYAELEKEKALLMIEAALNLEGEELKRREERGEYQFGERHQLYLKQQRGADDILRNDYQGKSNVQVIKSIEDKYGKKIDSLSFQQKAEFNVSERNAENWKKLLFAAFWLWLTPIIFLYLSGLSVAWIVRGFRR